MNDTLYVEDEGEKFPCMAVTATMQLRLRKEVVGVIPGTNAHMTKTILEQGWLDEEGSIHWIAVPTVNADGTQVE